MYSFEKNTQPNEKYITKNNTKDKHDSSGCKFLSDVECPATATDIIKEKFIVNKKVQTQKFMKFFGFTMILVAIVFVMIFFSYQDDAPRSLTFGRQKTLRETTKWDMMKKHLPNLKKMFKNNNTLQKEKKIKTQNVYITDKAKAKIEENDPNKEKRKEELNKATITGQEKRKNADAVASKSTYLNSSVQPKKVKTSLTKPVTTTPDDHKLYPTGTLPVITEADESDEYDSDKPKTKSVKPNVDLVTEKGINDAKEKYEAATLQKEKKIKTQNVYITDKAKAKIEENDPNKEKRKEELNKATITGQEKRKNADAVASKSTYLNSSVQPKKVKTRLTKLFTKDHHKSTNPLQSITEVDEVDEADSYSASTEAKIIDEANNSEIEVLEELIDLKAPEFILNAPPALNLQKKTLDIVNAMKILQAKKSTRNEIDEKIKDLYALFPETENANEEIKQWIYAMMPKDSEETEKLFQKQLEEIKQETQDLKEELKIPDEKNQKYETG